MEQTGLELATSGTQSERLIDWANLTANKKSFVGVFTPFCVDVLIMGTKTWLKILP